MSCGEIAGFKAKALCSNAYNSQRDKASIEEDELTILIGLQNLVQEEIYLDKQKVETGFWFSKSIAVYREGLGATLLCEMTEEELMAQEVPDLTPLPLDQASLPWPTGDVMDYEIPVQVDKDKLADAVAFAFEEPVPGERNRRTRAVVVLYDGLLIVERYAEEDGIYENTWQVGWSMTKSVINTLVGISVGQGKLDIYKSAPVPEWSEPSDPRHAITLDDLMKMSSGLGFNEELEVLFMI